MYSRLQTLPIPFISVRDKLRKVREILPIFNKNRRERVRGLLAWEQRCHITFPIKLKNILQTKLTKLAENIKIVPTVKTIITNVKWRLVGYVANFVVSRR